MPLEQYRDVQGKKRYRRATKVADWLVGNVVPVRKVPVGKRLLYRSTLRAAARAARDAERVLFVRSSFRTYTEQVALYDKYLHHGGNLAAVPGTSRHEKGNALDLGVGTTKDGPDVRNVDAVKRTLIARGFVFAVASEAWHVEYRGSSK